MVDGKIIKVKVGGKLLLRLFIGVKNDWREIANVIDRGKKKMWIGKVSFYFTIYTIDKRAYH